MSDDDKLASEMAAVRRELATIRQLLTSVVTFVREAESEVPEKMRRYVNYMHDIHDIKFMYEELGHSVPVYILRELERLDDRCRQLLEQQHVEGGTFAKVRAEMAKDPANRWDHTRQLVAPKENGG